ncbi:MAG: nuclear transport factor 2 family protein [Cyclobacteriaceae bacterium]
MKRFLFSAFIFALHMQVVAQQSTDKEEILKVAHQFFEALEKQDTVTFSKILVKNSFSCIVVEGKDSARLVSRQSRNFGLKPENIVKERMRESQVKIEIHKRIATVWAPYNLWVNDKFSYCGVDVFIMLKGNKGWKIGTISYSIEKEGCQ